MTAKASGPDTDPLTVIVGLIVDVERVLDEDRVRDVVIAVIPSRVTRRRVAQALTGNPDVLETGRSPSVWSVGKLLVALKKAGARQIAAPRCYDCDRELTTLASRKGGLWVCSMCINPPQPCARCGRTRQVSSRDRHGRPRCQNCPDQTDPTDELITLVSSIDPGLSRQAIRTALQHAAVRPTRQHRLAWAILEHPDLLTGAGAQAPAPTVLRFLDALIDAGATTLTLPACPRCGQINKLCERWNGQRICARCYHAARATECARCGNRQPAKYRDQTRRPVCGDCLDKDPASHEECTSCGRRRRVVTRTAAGPFCKHCRPRPALVCSICGRTRICETSQATGRPWCGRCRDRWDRCNRCQTVAPLRGGTLDAPLCARCLNPDPNFWDRCPTCLTTWQFSTRPCQRCALDHKLFELLAAGTGTIPPALEPFRHALANVERPDQAIAWITSSKVHDLITAISSDPRPLTHQTLDGLPAGKTLIHLRASFVASGTLPPRDERLTELQAWTTTAVAARKDTDERRVLHGYAIWHHLRRLRQRLGNRHATHRQVLYVRRHITAAAQFMDWLASEDLNLTICTQADLDRWLTSDRATYPAMVTTFIRWAVTNRHANNSTPHADHQQRGPRGPHNGEHRWRQARRLLHDDTVPTPDRVAGLLVLLYAQRLTTISRLTTDHIQHDHDRVLLKLGSTPIALPEPLDNLVLELLATRRGSTLIGTPGTSPWLFPGRSPGQHISADQIACRLKHLGLQPHHDRSAALFALAAQLPAAILARTLGLHITVAVAWQQAASGDWTTYAADVARRAIKEMKAPPVVQHDGGHGQ